MRVSYPDLYDPSGAPEENFARARLYAATCYLLAVRSPAGAGALIRVGSAGAPGAPIPAALEAPPEDLAGAAIAPAERLRALAVYGQLLKANMSDPALGRPADAPRGQNEIVIEVSGVDEPAEYAESITPTIRIVPRFIEAHDRAAQTYAAHRTLFDRVYRYLEQVGGSLPTRSDEPPVSHVFAQQLAQVVQRLVERGVGPDAPQLRLQIAGCVEASVSAASGGWSVERYSAVDLDLPDLASEM